MGIDIDTDGVDQSLAQLQAPPGRGQVDLLPVEIEACSEPFTSWSQTKTIICSVRSMILQVIGVGHVELELGELGVVLEGDALVAEIAPDLVDPIQPAHQQAFEVKLKRNAQVEILVELVVVGDEGLGSRTAVDAAAGWGFPPRGSRAHPGNCAGRVTTRGALAEDLAHFGVDRQVGVALAEARFGVGQGGVAHDLAIHHFVLGSRQGGDGFGQHGEGGTCSGDLAGAGAEEGAAGLDDIAQVELLVEELEWLFAQLVDAQEELDAAGAVFDVGEGELAHRAHGAQPAGDGHYDGVG